MSKTPFEIPELAILIFTKLSRPDLEVCRRVCKAWDNFIKHEKFYIEIQEMEIGQIKHLQCGLKTYWDDRFNKNMLLIYP